MPKIFSYLILSIVAFASMTAQNSSTSAVVREGALHGAVVRDPVTNELQLRHNARGRSSRDPRRHVLEYAIYVPGNDVISVGMCQPPEMKPFVTVVPGGSYGGRSVVRVEVDLLAYVAAGFAMPRNLVVPVQWATPLLSGPSINPPVGPAVINHDWTPILQRRNEKTVESVQDISDPTQWYHRGGSFVKLETEHDGVALIHASAVMPLATFRSLDSIALFWRGRQQPIHVVDADASASFTLGDRIYFLGRHAVGDTTYLDESDTSAIFYLTGSLSGEAPLRYSAKKDEPIDSVFFSLERHVHIELDTGYFHPGNGADDDNGPLLTRRAALEGFYWTGLNARQQQAAAFPIPFTSSLSGDVELSATIVTTTDSRAYDPDHAIDVVFPGDSQARRLEVNGYGRFRISDTIRAEDLSPGTNSVYVRATGFPERLSKNDWSSLVLVDAVDARGQGASIASSGRLDGRVSLDRNAALQVSNLPSAEFIVIDTVRGELLMGNATRREYSVRAGVWPTRNTKNPVQIVSARYALAVTIDDQLVQSDSVDTFATVLFSGTPARPALQLHTDAASLIRSVEQAPPSAPLVIVQTRGLPDASIVAALRSRGVQFDPGSFPSGWVCSIVGSDSWVSAPSRHVKSYLSDVGTSWTGGVNLSRGEHSVFIGSGPGIETARVSAATNGFLSKRDWSDGAGVIAIVHGELLPEARRWAEHRESYSGKSVVVVDVADVFEAYGAGRHDPRALRAFLRDAWQRSEKHTPTHCVLIGNASWDIRQAVRRGNVDASRVDQVPTYGRPSSDLWFGLLDDEFDMQTPELIVTRFPCSTPAEAKVLVDKIITADTTPYAPYMRRFLYAGGGDSDDSFCEIYERILRDEFGTGVSFVEPPLCIDTVTICSKSVDNPGRRIREQINQGVGLVNFIGHGGTEVFDIDDWRPNQLNNYGRYPILGTFSCLTGSYSSPSAICENAKYLLEPEKGAVGSIGSTGYQYIGIADMMHYLCHEVLYSTSIRDLGALTYAAKLTFAKSNTTYGNNAAFQFCVLGDPFTRVRIDTVPELNVASDRISFSNSAGSSPIVDEDSVLLVRTDLWNQGLATERDFDVRLVRSIGAYSDTFTLNVDAGFCRTMPLEFRVPIAGMPGFHRFMLTADPSGVIADQTSNNVATAQLDVRRRSMVILEPDAYEVVDPSALSVRVLDVLSKPGSENELEVVFAVCSRPDTSTVLLRSTAKEPRRSVEGAPMIIDWRPTSPLQLDSGRTYWIGVWPHESAGAAAAKFAWQPFVASKGADQPTRHLFLPDELSGGDAGVVDVPRNVVTLPKLPIPMTVLSGGKPTSDPVRQPYMSFRLRDSIILENSFRQGLNVVVFAPYDSVPRAIRRYDTSPNSTPLETGHNGYARECIRFLRDSVRPTDIVAMVACDESFTRFKRDTLFEEFRAQLRRFGARLADSLQPSSSYVLIGSVGGQTSPLTEKHSASGAIVSSTVDVPFTASELSLPLPPVVVGWWNSLQLRSRGNTSVTSVRTSSAGATDTVLISGAWSPESGYTYRMSSLSMRADMDDPAPIVESIDMEYSPRPQIIINGGGRVSDTALRGDTLILKPMVINARRFYSDVTVSLRLTARDTTGDVLTIQTDTLNVSPSSSAFGSYKVSTESAPRQMLLQYEVDPDGSLPLQQRIFWRWNGLGTVAEDTTAPEIILYADNVPCIDGAKVAPEPRLSVLVTDRSNLPIESSDNVTVFVNGTRIRRDNVAGWEFLGTSRLRESSSWGADARALLSFVFPMEPGENLVIARARDISGNGDTAEISLFRQDQSSISNLLVYPNPATVKGTVTVKFDVVLVDASANLRLSIYDLQGRLFRSSTIPSTPGRSAVKLDLGDRDGALEAPATGMYTLVVELLSQEGRTLSTVTKN
ncbi:MAG: C25 family cysteine peptidase, partial [Candidatus Kapaibacterium sp.]